MSVCVITYCLLPIKAVYPQIKVDFVKEVLIIRQAYLVEQCQVKALELFGVELHGQSWSLSCKTLQLLNEVPALGQRYTSPPPTDLCAGLWWRLLTNQGNQAVVLDF